MDLYALRRSMLEKKRRGCSCPFLLSSRLVIFHRREGRRISRCSRARTVVLAFHTRYTKYIYYVAKDIDRLGYFKHYQSGRRGEELTFSSDDVGAIIRIFLVEGCHYQRRRAGEHTEYVRGNRCLLWLCHFER